MRPHHGAEVLSPEDWTSPRPCSRPSRNRADGRVVRRHVPPLRAGPADPLRSQDRAGAAVQRLRSAAPSRALKGVGIRSAVEVPWCDRTRWSSLGNTFRLHCVFRAKTVQGQARKGPKINSAGWYNYERGRLSGSAEIPARFNRCGSVRQELPAQDHSIIAAGVM